MNSSFQPMINPKRWFTPRLCQRTTCIQWPGSIHPRTVLGCIKRSQRNTSVVVVFCFLSSVCSLILLSSLFFCLLILRVFACPNFRPLLLRSALYSCCPQQPLPASRQTACLPLSRSSSVVGFLLHQAASRLAPRLSHLAASYTMPRRSIARSSRVGIREAAAGVGVAAGAVKDL